MIGPHGGRAEPQVPVEFRRARAECPWAGRRRRRPTGCQTWTSPTGPIAPALHQFHHAAVVGAGVDLRAHLRGQLVLVGQLDHHAGFRSPCGPAAFRSSSVCPSSWPSRRPGAWDVIGRGDEHRVDLIAHFVEQLAEIAVASSPWGIVSKLSLSPALVYIAQGDDVLPGAIADVPGALPSHADPGDVQLFVGLSDFWPVGRCRRKRSKRRTRLVWCCGAFRGGSAALPGGCVGGT